MSIQFNDTTTSKGLVQFYETECGFNPGDISGNTAKLKQFTAYANLAHDELLTIGFKATGTWQIDDSNHGDMPFIKTNLVSGQKNYSFLTDEQGNLILDIHKVTIADSTGYFREMTPVDIQTRNNPNNEVENFINQQSLSGVPTMYDKTGNAITLDITPNYSYTNGLRVYINREGSYRTYSDTTQMYGVPANLHAWYYLKPAFEYISINGTTDAYNKILRKVQVMEKKIEETFSKRQRDFRGGLRTVRQNNK